jgi:hypothetical protein
MQWTTETPEPVSSPCPTCGIVFQPWASEDMTTAKFKSDNGIVDSAQLDLFGYGVTQTSPLHRKRERHRIVQA